MPTYAYRCTECGTAFDVQQAFTDDALTECPNCGGRLRKQYGSIGVSFTGSGFYRNDSRASVKSESGSGSSDSGSSGSGKTEAKPSTSEKTSSPAPSTGGSSTTSSSD